MMTRDKETATIYLIDDKSDERTGTYPMVIPTFMDKILDDVVSTIKDNLNTITIEDFKEAAIIFKRSYSNEDIDPDTIEVDKKIVASMCYDIYLKFSTILTKLYLHESFGEPLELESPMDFLIYSRVIRLHESLKNTFGEVNIKEGEVMPV